jgi:Fe-S cluster biogenesis protein NfuA
VLDFTEQFEAAAPELEVETAEDARFRRIANAIDEIRPRLQRDGGDCHLVSVEGNLVKVRMSGACAGCQLAFMTVHGIQAKLVEKLGFPVRVLPVPGA